MFLPFSGWLFNPALVADIGKATSPPYDVISEDERQALIARSPHNIVRLLLPGLDPASYELAAQLLARWQGDAVLARDDTKRFYLYEMDYTDASGSAHRARGVMGALELVPLGRQVVPHEETQDKHRADRLSILKATQANLDPIIALSAAAGLPELLAAPAGSPRLEFAEDDGSVHRLYDITDPEVVAGLSATIGAQPLSIADGHHRYTTALGYRGDRGAVDGAGPWDFIMAMVSPAEGSGLTIGPYHRILPGFDFDAARLTGAFDVSIGAPTVPDDPGSLVIVAGMTAYHLRPHADATAHLPSPWRQASAAVAAEVLYPILGVDETGARYSADASEAAAAAASGEEVAVLVAPVTERAVAEAGELGIRFPTKTTFFTPKPRAGLVVRGFDA
jgi:uncharacterized protein (DUF1015 family)